MNSLKIGTICIVAGCFMCIIDTMIGIGVIVAGALAIIVAEDKPEKPVVKEHATGEESRVKIVGNQALLLDKDNFVIGASDLPGIDKKQLK